MFSASSNKVREALLALAVVCAAVPAFAGMNTGKVEPPAKTAVRRTEPVYKVEAGLNGEIFPAFANYASFQAPTDRKWGTVAVTITNASDAPLHNRIAVKVNGWSDEEIQMADMAAGEVHTFIFSPSFLPRFYENHEIAAATALVSVTDAGGRSVFSATAPVRLRAAGDMYWGPSFKYAPFIAAWVTPHDPRVEEILMRAKDFMPGHRLPGYETWISADAQVRSTTAQAKAIYNALKLRGMSYVKSSNTLGGQANESVTERVRMPYETLRQVSANCIDGAVMYAALFENLGMDPVIVLVPGHAYVGVRVSEKSSKYLYIETALTGRAPFETAVKLAEQGLAHWPAAQVTRIDIDSARRAGIYPMPLPTSPAAAAQTIATGR